MCLLISSMHLTFVYFGFSIIFLVSFANGLTCGSFQCVEKRKASEPYCCTMDDANVPCCCSQVGDVLDVRCPESGLTTPRPSSGVNRPQPALPIAVLLTFRLATLCLE
ncbi:uncharacterized protein LOC128209935 [Mya arenaria]|uniref:uncharacterized protein LOC128209935 n=1 Tax=Mya arenaria TaxID=6604 RepID=UPI0022E549A1|nr:uncharacterized protein LOC128209935 [Mya arenaria]